MIWVSLTMRTWSVLKLIILYGLWIIWISKWSLIGSKFPTPTLPDNRSTVGSYQKVMNNVTSVLLINFSHSVRVVIVVEWTKALHVGVDVIDSNPRWDVGSYMAFILPSMPSQEPTQFPSAVGIPMLELKSWVSFHFLHLEPKPCCLACSGCT